MIIFCKTQQTTYYLNAAAQNHLNCRAQLAPLFSREKNAHVALIKDMAHRNDDVTNEDPESDVILFSKKHMGLIFTTSLLPADLP